MRERFIIYNSITIIFLMLLTSFLKAQVVITDITATNLNGDSFNDGKYGGHGIMFADVDNDNDPDMYITMNNSAPMADQFFENNGSGVFTEKGVQRGIDNYDSKGSHGWVWADLDNDGDFDGWNGSYTQNIPYMNKNDHPGYFENKFSTSGIENIELGTRGVAAFDFDNDGDLDLFGNNWYARNTLEQNEFYRNNGDFTFTRIDNGLTYAKGDQGVCDGDFDNDGDIDLLLSVFEGNVDGRCVQIMENIDGQFFNLENSGLTLCNGSYDGVTFWDMNNDGWLDIVSGEKIFINNGNKTFSELLNVPAGMRIMRGIADLNNDGFWDLITPGSNTIYINNGDLTFSTVTYSPGTINDPRCVSFADIDGDGDVDFALGQKAAFNRLYRNDYNGVNKSLFIKLKSADNQIGAFGAKVFIYSENGDTLLNYRQAHSNQGYLSQDDPTLHFGCGLRDNVLVKVIFLNGQSREFVTNTNKSISIPPASISVKLFLEGNYSNNSLRTYQGNNLPLTQPYNVSPWNYSGKESIESSTLSNFGIIDWVLLELRKDNASASNILARKSVLITNNGMVLDIDGSPIINFWGTPPGMYYLIIHHRNHLPIMSSAPINF